MLGPCAALSRGEHFTGRLRRHTTVARLADRSGPMRPYQAELPRFCLIRLVLARNINSDATRRFWDPLLAAPGHEELILTYDDINGTRE